MQTWKQTAWLSLPLLIASPQLCLSAQSSARTPGSAHYHQDKTIAWATQQLDSWKNVSAWRVGQ
jgi:hypothetical protein